MNKNILIACLLIAIVVGSLATFHVCNFIFGDIANLGTGLINNTSLVNLPIAMFAAITICVPFYLLRLFKKPKNIKRLSTTYCIIVFCLSLIGLIGSLLSGLLVYRSFIKPYPFPGYLIIGIIIHSLLMTGMPIIYFLFVRQLKEDEERFKVTPRYVLYSIGMFMFVGLAYNRFGALLMSGLFMTSNTFLMTVPLYLSLLIPLALLIIKTLSIVYRNVKLSIPIIAIMVINIFLFIITIIIGYDNTLFISAVSPVLPLERLASFPLEIFLHFFINLGVSIGYIFKEKKRLISV